MNAREHKGDRRMACFSNNGAYKLLWSMWKYGHSKRVLLKMCKRMVSNVEKKESKSPEVKVVRLSRKDSKDNPTTTVGTTVSREAILAPETRSRSRMR